MFSEIPSQASYCRETHLSIALYAYHTVNECDYVLNKDNRCFGYVFFFEPEPLAKVQESILFILTPDVPSGLRLRT